MRPRSLLAVALVVAVGIPFSGCGSDDERAAAPGTTIAGTRTVLGFEFTTVVPQGWADVSNQLNAAETRYDIAYSDPRPAGGPKPTLTVLRRRGGSYAGRTVAQVAAASRQLYERQPGLEVGAARRLILAGAPAVQTTVTGSEGGARLSRREVIALRDGTLYVLVVAGKAGDPSADAALRDAVAGWRWTS